VTSSSSSSDGCRYWSGLLRGMTPTPEPFQDPACRSCGVYARRAGVCAVAAAIGWGLLLGLVLVLMSCSPPQGYVAEDRARYEAIAPEYRDYVVTDVTMPDEHRRWRLDLLDAWLEAIESAEGE